MNLRTRRSSGLRLTAENERGTWGPLMQPERTNRGDMSQDSAPPTLHRSVVKPGESLHHSVAPSARGGRRAFDYLSNSSVGLELGISVVIGLFAAFLKLKAFLVDLARKHVAHGPETEPHKQHAHGDEDEGDDGWEKGRADGRGQGFDDPLIDVAVKIDEKEHEEEADARFDPDVSPL